MDASSPTAALYDMVDSSNRRVGRKVFCYGKQRDAAWGRQPLVPAEHQGVRAPFAHRDRESAGHLRDVNHDPGTHPSGTRHQVRDVDQAAGGLPCRAMSFRNRTLALSEVRGISPSKA